ncbi:MAG TPA: transcription initiation factor IIB [Nitrososphaeraceae archaeon]|jgi:transcription initiation factor TFIIB|nr:transcription initiation factor IIB [Nitrososphaeraceae archaeon]
MIELPKCSVCNDSAQSIITDPESGEIICSNCGIIILDKLEDYIHEERRAFTMEEAENRSRTGAPTSLAIYDRGLSTTISKVNRDAYGKMFDAAALPQVKKLRRWNSMINLHGTSEKSLNRAFRKLDILNDKLGLSRATVEKIAYIFRKLHERDLVRGRTIDGMLSAAVYATCREIGSSITLKDIATASNLTQKDVSRNYKVILFELDIKIPLVDPMKCIVKVANKLGINEKIKKRAMNIMNEVVKREMTPGKAPMGLAASVLYLSCQMAGEEVSQASIATASGVTEVTIRKRLKDLMQLNLLI